jgi:hypothetical protein
MISEVVFEIMRIIAPFCVLGFVMVWEVFLLKNIAKEWLGFLPLLRRVSQDTSCVLVHGYSSCDLGLMQLVIVVAIVYGSSKC